MFEDLRQIGDQAFGAMPRSLRAVALQIEMLASGLKPALLVSVFARDVSAALQYLTGRGFFVTVREVPRHPALFGQLAPVKRAQLAARGVLQLYVGRTAADSRKVASAATSGSLGEALGYPSCCVDAHTARDEVHETDGHCRQANLNIAALRASTRLDTPCNTLLSESEVSGEGPTAPVAHYPCRFDCAATAALARTNLTLASRVWPLWSISWARLLRQPMLFWDDTLWEHDFWDEYCGASLGAAVEQGATGSWRIGGPIVRLGSGRTPAGEIPPAFSYVCVDAARTVFVGSDASVVFRHDKAGRPWVLDWGAGSLIR